MRNLRLSGTKRYLFLAFVFTGAFVFTAIYAAAYENSRLHFIASLFLVLSIFLGFGALAAKNWNNERLKRPLWAAIALNFAAQTASSAKDLIGKPSTDRYEELVCMALIVAASVAVALAVFRVYKSEGSENLKIPAYLICVLCAYEIIITVLRIIMFCNFYIYLLLWVAYALAYLLNMGWFFFYLYYNASKIQ